MRTLLAATSLALVMIACAGTATAPSFPTAAPSPTRLGTLTLSETACALEGVPATVRPGLSSLTVINRLSGVGIADFVQIVDGKTFDDMSADIQVAIEAAVAGQAMVFRPSYLISTPVRLGAGGSTTLTSTLLAGTYGIVCLRIYEHIGEIRPFAVAGPIEVR